MSILRTVLIVALILLSLVVFLQNAPRVWDLQLWDETLFMASGIYNWHGNFINYENSPLYSYIYRLTNVFLPDPIQLQLWMGVAVVGCAIFCTAMSVYVVSNNAIWAASSASILLSSGYALATPKLVYAAISLMAAGYGLSSLADRPPLKFVIIAVTAFIISFIRPEFVLAFYISLASSILLFILDRRFIYERRNLSFITIGLYVAIALLCYAWSFPRLSGGARALMAFGQHYSVYLAETGRINVDPYFNYQRIMAEHLPGAKSEIQALLLYPSNMMEFFFYNISNTFVRAAAGISSMLTGQFALFLLVAISILFSLSPKNIPRFSINNFASWAVIALPTIISIVFIFAREHYLIFLSTLTILLFATIARNLKLRDSFPVAVMVIISTIFFVPPLRESVKRPFTDTAVALAKIRPFGNLLEMDGGWCYFAPHVCRPIFALEVKTADMVDYLEEGHVNGIMVSSASMAWAEQNNQPVLVELMKNGSPEWDKRALSDEFSLMIRNKIDREGLDNVFTSNIMSFVGIVHVGRAPSTVQKKTARRYLSIRAKTTRPL